MNKRIKELAADAGYPDYMTYGQDKVLEKFAELVVRECMDVCYRTDTENEGKKVKSTVIASKVATHFGVEE